MADVHRRRKRLTRVALVATLGAALACQPAGAPHAPRRYLAITHPALNRLTFFDLDARRVVGALPAQKLPHDMLLSPDRRTLYVVCSGAQCITTYHLDAPELWREAAAFMRRDTVRTGARMEDRPAGPHPAVEVPAESPAPARPPEAGTRAGGLTYLHPDPVQSLPPSVAEFHLTDPTFPDTMNGIHARVGAAAHRACFDCHARSLGAKPFGPTFSADGASILLVHLAARNLTVLDARTLSIRRQVKLDVPSHYAPVEAWVRPGTSTAFVTCRDEIGQSRPGVILVVDLDRGTTLTTLQGGIYPWHMVPAHGGDRLLVDNFQSSRISVVDVASRKIVDSLIVQNGPAIMLPSSDGRRLYVSCFYTHRVLVVDLDRRQVERVIPVDSNPTSMLLAPDGRTLLVLCGGESTLDLVDLGTSTVQERHPLLFGAYAFQLVESPPSVR